MISIFAVKCLHHHLGILENALQGVCQIEAKSLEELDGTEIEAHLVLVGWGSDPNASLLLLRDTFKKLAFRDIPILIVTDLDHAGQAQLGVQRGASGILTSPFEKEKIAKTIQEALKPAGGNPNIDVRFVNPFVDSTLEVLGKMAQTEVERRDVLLKRDYRLFGDVSAVIGICGDNVEGSVGVTFEDTLAALLVARMLGEDPSNVEPSDVQDGVGEIVNMISGRAKTLLSAEGIHFNLALPTVVAGPFHEIAHKKGTPCLVLVFETTEGHVFAVQVSIAS